jgi:hypothetical protein
MRPHALHRDCHFLRIVLGKERTLQAMTIETFQQLHFLGGRAWRALHQLGVGQLQARALRGFASARSSWVATPRIALVEGSVYPTARIVSCIAGARRSAGGSPFTLVLTETS